MEQAVLDLSGVPRESIKVRDVAVGLHKGEVVTIRTIMCGNEDNPPLVMFHGYGNSGCLFF